MSVQHLRHFDSSATASETPERFGPQAFASLFKPLPFLLVEGGDTRLTIERNSRANAYGCRPYPTPETLTFSSSTATSISGRAYRRAERARSELMEEIITLGVIEAFDRQNERLRHSLRDCLGMNNAEIVFSPSGTDTQLHALYFARRFLGGPVTSIVVGADQTGSGTAYTSRGQNFSNRTAQGVSVVKGSPIAGLAEDVDSLGISLFAEDGTTRSANEIDAAVIEAVAEQVRLGRKIVLQTMDSSKLGWRAPSDACLREIGVCWPDAVQVVVDACQMRIGRPRIRTYLDRGYIVLLTGSKFFTGPAFGGASLYPASLSGRIGTWTELPDGLAKYATRFDLPVSWSAIRSALPIVPNFGQWLRWEAALEEMRAYYSLPQSYRQIALKRLGETILKLIASSQHLELMPGREASADALDDEEMSYRTIFPFLVKRNGRNLEIDAMTRIYHGLTRDLSRDLPEDTTDADRASASTPCHIGQPVKLPASKTILRFGIGARLLSESWSPDSRTAAENLSAIVRQIGTVVRKIDLIVRTGIYDAAGHPAEPAEQRARPLC